MNNSQRLGIFFLILITEAYVYFSFFNGKGFEFPKITNPINNSDNPPPELEIITPPTEITEPQDEPKRKEVKTVKIYITDSKGNLRPVNRTCDTSVEKSCFAFAIKELIKAPSQWEKDKGLSSEIPSNTKVLSVREGSDNILIDLSGAFESGGGAESIYIRVHQLIKTSQANTKRPVFLYINGKQADVIGGEGIMIKQPLSERSFND